MPLLAAYLTYEVLESSRSISRLCFMFEDCLELLILLPVRVLQSFPFHRIETLALTRGISGSGSSQNSTSRQEEDRRKAYQYFGQRHAIRGFQSTTHSGFRNN